MVMKFPPYDKKKSSDIIKIDKPHEKSLIITLFQLFTDIFTQNSMVKSHSSTSTSLIHTLPMQKHYKFIKNWLQTAVPNNRRGWGLPCPLDMINSTEYYYIPKTLYNIDLYITVMHGIAARRCSRLAESKNVATC